MIVFKTFLKVLNKYKATAIMYTVILLVFGTLNMNTNDNSMVTFSATKPDILIVNNDEEKGITKNLIDYLKEKCNIIDIDKEESKIDDALFYRDVNYVIYIENGYREKILNKENVILNVKSTGDYNASLAEMILKDYISTQNIFVNEMASEEEIIKSINETLKNTTKVELTSNLDLNETNKASTYFNFASYSIMAAIIFVICLVLSSFNEKNVKKRTIVSSKNYKRQNRELLFSSFSYTIVLWLLYVLFGIFILGDFMLSIRGLLFMLNSLLFSICSLTIAILISTAVNNKDAISGIVNVVALGSSFLCGAFVPTSFLPDFVLKIAHLLPSYWYINTNDTLAVCENFDFSNLYGVFFNMVILIIFSLVFIIINNVVSRNKQKFN